VLIGARPHEVSFVDGGPGRLPVRANLTEHLGRNNFVICSPRMGTGCLESGDAIQVETPAGIAVPAGAETFLAFDVGALKVFDMDGVALKQQPIGAGAERRARGSSMVAPKETVSTELTELGRGVS
jgi:hypothetical protein